MKDNQLSPISKALRVALFSSATLMASLPFAVNAAEETADDEGETITITGSRIKRSNLTSSSPIVSISGEELTMKGTIRVEDFLNDLPQIFPGQTSGTANGSDGTATVDLRFLGPQRTLVLMNGRRLPTGSPQTGGGADINQIPGALIERVELLTGGASSTYGSDAIAGVVNFIMKDDFEGVQLDYQYSFYQHDNSNSNIQNVVRASDFTVADGNVTDGDAHNFSIIVGANTADGRGNITAYASVRDVEEITQESRDYSGCALGLAGNDFTCRGSSTIPNTRVTDFAGGFDFQVDGTDFVPFNSLYNYGPLNHFQRPNERRNLGAFVHYDLSNESEIYGEFNIMDNRTDAQIAPSGAFFVTNQIPCANPLLSAQQFEQLCGQFGLTTADIQTAYIGRRNVEGGPRDDNRRSTSYRGVLGMRGDFDENWSYDVSYNYGTVIFSQVYENDLSITNIQRALNATTDANGNVVCQSVIDGSDAACVPWNVFQTGGVTQNQINYLVKPLFSQGETVTKQFVGFVSGDLTDAGIVLPGVSEGAKVVFGIEVREQLLDFNPDFGFTSGDGAGQGGPTTPVNGRLDVDEFFAELSLPLFDETGLSNYVNLDVGYRFSDYSTGKSTDTYKVALDWEINDSVKLRTSFQSASRHANITELFSPQGLGLFNMNEDPCAGGTPLYTAEQCARTGVTADRYGTIADSPAGQYNGIFGGNPDLAPEDSDTISFGVILSPIDELDIALDYFNIDVQGAIGTIPGRQILDDCALNNDAASCALINRGPTQTLWIGADNIVQTNINTGFLETEGVDFDVSYKYETDDMGKLNFNLLGTYLLAWDNKTTPTADVIECLGHWDRNSCGAPTPEWRWNLVTSWTTPWDATVTGTIRYFGEVNELGNGPTPLDAETYLDIATSWNLSETTTVRFGISNLLDEEPPIIPNAPSGIANGNTFPGSYDYLGRYIFAGITYSL